MQRRRKKMMTCQKRLGFYRDVLTVLVYGQASMPSDLIRKMFLLCLFADFICRNSLEKL